MPLGDTQVARSHHQIACEVGAALTSGVALDEALEDVARRITEALGVWECDVYEYYPDSETIVATTAWAREMTQEDRDWIGTVWSLSERASYHRVLLDGVLDEAYADDEEAEPIERELMAQWGELATMSVPLAFQGRVIGCFTLIEKRSIRRFSDEDRELVRLLAAPGTEAVAFSAPGAPTGRWHHYAPDAPELALHRVALAPGEERTFPIPLSRGHAAIALAVERWFRPSDVQPGSDDVRRLGAWIEFRP